MYDAYVIAKQYNIQQTIKVSIQVKATMFSYEMDDDQMLSPNAQDTYDEKFIDNIDTISGTIKSLLFYYVGKIMNVLIKKILGLLEWLIAVSFYENKETKNLGEPMTICKTLKSILRKIQSIIGIIYKQNRKINVKIDFNII